VKGEVIQIILSKINVKASGISFQFNIVMRLETAVKKQASGGTVIDFFLGALDHFPLQYEREMGILVAVPTDVLAGVFRVHNGQRNSWQLNSFLFSEMERCSMQ
jgi:hypothetical protein